MWVYGFCCIQIYIVIEILVGVVTVMSMTVVMAMVVVSCEFLIYVCIVEIKDMKYVWLCTRMKVCEFV